MEDFNGTKEHTEGRRAPSGAENRSGGPENSRSPSGDMRGDEYWCGKCFEGLKDAVIIETPDGVILDANKAACRMLGYSKDELAGMDMTKIMPAEVVKTPPAAVGNGSCVETRNMRKDGMIVPVEASRTLVEFNGRPRVIAVLRDISDRKAAEKTLRESELKYRTLLENLPQKIFYKDTDLVYVSCNDNFAGDLKMKPAKIVGKSDYDLYPKSLADSYRKVDKQVMRSGKTEYFEEDYIKGGRELIVRTVKTPVRDAKGNITGILGIFWDITRRKRDEAKLKKYQRKLEEMVKVRTAKLTNTNKRLLREIGDRKEVEKALRESESKLKEQKVALERKNIALGEVLEQIEHEKRNVKNDVVMNVERLLMPMLRKLKGKATSIEGKYIELLRKSCEDLASSFGRTVASEKLKLSPREIEISNMIKEGLTGKEIADMLKISFKTVERHRSDIRNKLKLVRKKVNLATYLRSL